MSYDQIIKWAFISTIILIDIVLLSFCPLVLQWSDLIKPGLCAILLAVLSIYYTYRGGDSLVLCMVTLLHIGSYTTAISVLIYAVTSLAFPVADPWLQGFDRLVGFSPQAIVQWTREHPAINHWSTWVYLFIVPETMLTILAIAFCNQRILLEQFVCQFMLGTGICAVTGCFFPAAGPAYNHGIEPAEWQLPYLDHFLRLRSGEPFLFSWQGTEGLVTFPSFHTAWAIMLILVWRKQTKWLSVPISIFSVMIILSTLTTASHYIIDIVGGIGLAGVCAWASQHVTAFAYHPDGAPKRVPIPRFAPVKPVGQPIA